MLGSTFLRLRRPLFFVLAAGSVVACTRGDAGPGDPGATGKTDEAPSAESFRFPLDDWSSEGGYVFGSPWLGTDGFHTGVDMHTVGGSAAGDPVHAAANGVVHGYISAAPWGDAALVRHEVPGEGTVYTQYWHVNRGDNVGMRVAKGQVFTSLYDLAGTSEGRYGNHVHFAVWVGEFADATWSGHLPSPDYPGRTFPDGFVEPVDYVNRHGGGASPSSDDCGGLTYQGECVGSTVRWCEGGVREVDCSATGEVCAWESDAIGYNCVPAPPAPWCGDGTCNGGEGCGTCARDCGACPPECGDGT
jgi:hypothetical protein